MELRVLRSESEAIFPHGVAHLMGVAATALGAVMCYRDPTNALHVVHIDGSFSLIDAVAIPHDSSEQWPTGAEIHRICDDGTSFLISLSIHHRVDFVNEAIPSTTWGMRPRWYSLEVRSDGALAVRALAFWEHEFLHPIRSVRHRGKTHWVAARSFPPRDEAEAQRVGFARRDPHVALAITESARLPEFTAVERTFDLGRFPRIDPRVRDDGGLCVAISAPESRAGAVHLCTFDAGTMRSREINVGRRTGGGVGGTHLFKAPGDRFTILCDYDNGKKKRRTRDRGVWFCSFSAIDDEMEIERLSDDSEACWNNLSTVQTDESRVVALWTSGFSRKTAVCRLVECDLDSRLRREQSVRCTVDGAMLVPRHLMHMGETLFFFDLVYGIILIER